MAVLYACNSAIPADMGRATTGAAQALLMAGTKCVVAMQAPVFDVPSIRRIFTEILYSQLQANGSITTAMRAVRSQLSRTGAWWIPTTYLRGDYVETALFETSADHPG